MEKILKDLAAALDAEKINTDHLVVAKELVKQVAARLALHTTAVAEQAKVSPEATKVK